MHNAEPLSVAAARQMCCIETVEHAADHTSRHCGLYLAPARSEHQLGERLSDHVLHDEEHLAPVAHDIEGGHDVWMRNSRRQPRLLSQDGLVLRRANEIGLESLDRHDSTKAAVGGHAPQMNRGHPATCDGVAKRVPTAKYVF